MNTKTTLVSAICGIALFLTAGMLCTTDAQASDLAVVQGQNHKYEGTIQSVNLDEKNFVLEVPDARFKHLTITFNPQTTYTLDGEEAERDDVLKAGMDVTVTTRGESHVALSVAGTTE